MRFKYPKVLYARATHRILIIFYFACDMAPEAPAVVDGMIDVGELEELVCRAYDNGCAHIR